MTNSKNTKRALFTSVVAILLCCTMLLGTTFAWFTDTATSSNNRIQAGTLDIDLLMWNGTNYESIADETGDIFQKADTANNSNATLWEPGKTQVVYLAIENKGNLAAKYRVELNAYADKNNAVKTDMAPAMRYAITNNAQNGTGATVWDSSAEKTVKMGSNVTDAKSVAIGAGETHYFALSVHMDENAGNEYQGASILFDLIVKATQDTVEEDAMGNNQYDKDASLNTFSVSEPVVANGATIITVYDTYIADEKIAVVTVPEDAVATGTEEIKVTIVEEDSVNADVTVEDDEVAQTFDIDVTGLKAGNTTPVKVELFVGKGLTGVRLYHNNAEITNFYNAGDGYVKFETTSFSPFTVVYDATPVVEEGSLPDGMPVAKLENLSAETVNATLEWSSFGPFPQADSNQKLDAVYKFTAPHTSSTIASCGDYKDWHCDYVVSIDKDIPANAIFLAGNYGDFGWVGFTNPDEVKKNVETPLLGSVTQNPWTYEEVVGFVYEFTCGVARTYNTDADILKDATFTVNLRLTNPEDETEYYNVNTVKYTFQ